MWKSHVENADLYSQDSRGPLAGESSLQKPTLVSERLRARLRQQLAELRARLWPQSAATPEAVAGIRELLVPLTEQLQGTLSASVHDLCQQLKQHLQELQPAMPASDHQGAPSYQFLVPLVSRSLEASSGRMTSSILEFRARSTAAAESLQNTEQRELLLEVAARLGQEAASLEQEFRSRVGGLQASLGSLLLSAPPHGDGDMSSSTARFCQHTRALIQQFSQDLEGQFTQLEQRQAGGGSAPAPLRADFLREDFTSRLRSLLQEIMQTLN